MLGCLFCHRKLKLFKISQMHSNSEHPIKRYIIEFLGNCEQYLKDDYGVCCNCVYVLNNFLYIKRLMYYIVVRGESNFAKSYKTVVEQLQRVDYSDEGELDCSDNEDNLLQEQRSSPYTEEKENTLNITRNDKEVEAYMNRRKRKRGHGWSRRKRSQSRGRTALSEPIYRNNPSRAMSGNYSEYNKSDWGYSSDEDNDGYFQFSNNINKSNHISGTPSQKNTLNIYSCIKGCKYKSTNLTDMTEHKMKTHGMLAKYVCEECYRKRFVSSEDLKAHNDKCHNSLISFCLYCSEEMRTLDKLREHSENHPYSCMFCDLSFLTRIKLRKHSLQLHKWKRKKSVISRKIKRIVFPDKNTNNSSSTTNNVDYKEKIVKRLQTPSTQIDYASSYNDVIEGIFLEDDSNVIENATEISNLDVSAEDLPNNEIPVNSSNVFSFNDSNVNENANEISNVDISAADLPNNEILTNSSNVSDNVSPLSNDVCESFNEIEYDELNETEQGGFEQSIDIESNNVVEITETCISGEVNSINDDSFDRIIARAKETANTKYAASSFEEFEKFIPVNIPSTSSSPSPKNSKISDETQSEISPKSNNKNNLVIEKYLIKQDGML